MKTAALFTCLAYLAAVAAAPVELEERYKAKGVSVTFNKPGTFEWSVPINYAAPWTITCIGASGGFGGGTTTNAGTTKKPNYVKKPNAGGMGGVASGQFILYPQISYSIYIGQAGANGTTDTADKGASYAMNTAGGGGGASSFFLPGYSNSGPTSGSTQYFLTAGGGGGAGAGQFGNIGQSNTGQSAGNSNPGSGSGVPTSGGAGGGLTTPVPGASHAGVSGEGADGNAATDGTYGGVTNPSGAGGAGGFGGGGQGGSGLQSGSTVQPYGGGGGGGGWQGGDAGTQGNGGQYGYSYVNSQCTGNNNFVQSQSPIYYGASSFGNGVCYLSLVVNTPAVSGCPSS